MKKFLALIMALVMSLSLVACGGTDAPAVDEGSEGTESTLKVGVILIGDENEGYTAAHINGVKGAAANVGLAEENIVWHYNIPEDETAYDKCIESVEAGCNVVITNSYGHQSHAQAAAMENPEVQFVSATGDTAKKSGLPNFANAFNYTFQSRYVSGVVAGMKLAELVAADQVPAESKDADGNIKIGYVGAFPFAEVVSGYTAFYLGVKSVVENVVMEVQYTNSWFDQTAEGETANALINKGCVIICQHADSTGAPAAVEAAKAGGKTVYCVGYNVDMRAAAPTAALTSATNDWSKYYTFLFETVMAGETVPTDWADGYAVGAVGITELGAEVAEGTAEKVAEVEAALKDGSLQVFDTSVFTVGGETVTSALTFDTDGDFVNDENEGIVDGYYHESEYISAPSFSLRIDGITEVGNG